MKYKITPKEVVRSAARTVLYAVCENEPERLFELAGTYVEDLEPVDSSAMIWTYNGTVEHALALSLADTLVEQDNKEAMGKAALLIPEFSDYLVDAYNQMLPLSQEDREESVKHNIENVMKHCPKNRKPLQLIFAGLYLYANGIETKAMIPVLTDCEWILWAEREKKINTEHPFSEDPTVQRNVTRLRKRMAKELEVDPEALDETLQALADPRVTLSTFPYAIRNHTGIRLVKRITGTRQIEVDQMGGDDTIKESIDRTLISCQAMLMKQPSMCALDSLKTSSLEEVKRNQAPEKPDPETIRIQDINPLDLIVSCLWAYVLDGFCRSECDVMHRVLPALVGNFMVEHKELGIWETKLDREREKVKEAEELRQKEREESDRIIERLKRQRQSDLQKLKKKDALLKRSGYAGMSEMKALKKNLVSLKAQKEQLEIEKEALAEKISFYQSLARNAEPKRTADVDKPYLFVCTEERLASKLMLWFPNSMLSHMRDSIPDCYMAVFLTQCISHSEYYRIKEQCRNRNIPICNCNCQNFDRICNDIILCEDEYSLS